MVVDFQACGPAMLEPQRQKHATREIPMATRRRHCAELCGLQALQVEIPAHPEIWHQILRFPKKICLYFSLTSAPLCHWHPNNAGCPRQRIGVDFCQNRITTMVFARVRDPPEIALEKLLKQMCKTKIKICSASLSLW